jgi:hypothetical protein
MFAGGHLVGSGRRAVRTVVTAARDPRQVVEYRRRIEARLSHGAQGGALAQGRTGGSTTERPVMVTHSHPHGHLLGRDQGAPAQAQAQAAGAVPATKKD